MQHYFHDTLPPLPATVYPRVIAKPSKNILFWITRAVVFSVEVVTPLSFLYLAWFVYNVHIASGSKRLCALAVWAAMEVPFAVYYYYLSTKIQPPAPGTVMPHDALSDLFLRVLHAGLVVKAPLARTRAYSAPGSWPEVCHALSPMLDTISEKRSDSSGSSPSDIGLGLPGAASTREEKVARRRMTRLDSTAAQRPFNPEEDPDPLFDQSGRPIELDKDDPCAIEFREQLRTWFYHAPWEDIHADDVLHWLAWSAFGIPLDSVTDPKKKRFLDRTFTMLQARTGSKFPPGRSGTKVMLLTLDPIKTRQRPLIVYAISNSVNYFLRHILYPHRGAKFVRIGNIDFLVRIPEGWTPERGRKDQNAMPVVYMHGLGYGLLQNHLLLKHLVHSLPTHPLLVPLAYHTAQEIFNERYLKPWTRAELVETLKVACKQWGFWSPEEGGGVSMLSHSNGSVHHGWVVKDCPEMLRRNTFVDPVVFCLWEGDVCFNFCYRQPSTWLELLLDYFVATEIGIANYIHRHFVWSDNTLFVEDIPHSKDPTKTAIFVGGKDIIIDGPRTRTYLERHGMRAGLHWNPQAGHGDGLLGAARDRVVMYVGTGSTKGWEKWMTRGRRSHSLGHNDRPMTPNGAASGVRKVQ